jgi:hypothetical protein
MIAIGAGILVGWFLVWLKARHGETERVYLIYAVPALLAMAVITLVDVYRRSVLTLTSFYVIALFSTPPLIKRLAKKRKL